MCRVIGSYHWQELLQSYFRNILQKRLFFACMLLRIEPDRIELDRIEPDRIEPAIFEMLCLHWRVLPICARVVSTG